jgi:predicted PurR-regulated permease PerM
VGILEQPWNKTTRILAFLGIVVVLILAFWYFSGIISPVVIAAIFAYVLHPAVDFLTTKTKISHSRGVFIVYVVSLLLIAALLAWLTPELIQQLRVLVLELEELQIFYAEFLTKPVVVFGETIYLDQYLPALSTNTTDFVTPVFENVGTIVTIVTKNFLATLIILVSTYYFLADGHRIQPLVEQLVPENDREDIHYLYEQLRHVWADYLRSQLVFMFVVGLVDSIVWLAIGLPGAIILGFLTGVTSFVHEIGAIVSGILSVLAALIGGSNFLAMSNFWFAVLVFGLYMVLTGIKNIWIRPIVVGRHVHLHAGVVFVVVIAALIFHGALAAFLVIPVLVSLLVVGRYLRRQILGLPPFPPSQDPAQYFILSEKSQD